MTPRISIVLPSKYPDALRRCLKNIQDTTRNPHEIIVVTPPSFTALVDDPCFSPVKWIATDATGPIATQTVGVQHATGEFVFAFADDFLLVPGWDTEAMTDYRMNEGTAVDFLLGLRHEVVGAVFGTYYANFPFIRRTTIDRIGWYDATFRRGFGDCDLSLRVWSKDGRVEWSRKQLVQSTPDDGRKGATIFDPSDYNAFLNRWLWVYKDYVPEISSFDDFSVNMRLTNELVKWRTFNRCHREMMLTLSVPRLVSVEPSHNVVHFRGTNYKVPHGMPVDLEVPEDRTRLEVIPR